MTHIFWNRHNDLINYLLYVRYIWKWTFSSERLSQKFHMECFFWNNSLVANGDKNLTEFSSNQRIFWRREMVCRYYVLSPYLPNYAPNSCRNAQSTNLPVYRCHLLAINFPRPCLHQRSRRHEKHAFGSLLSAKFSKTAFRHLGPLRDNQLYSPCRWFLLF